MKYPKKIKVKQLLLSKNIKVTCVQFKRKSLIRVKDDLVLKYNCRLFIDESSIIFASRFLQNKKIAGVKYAFKKGN